MIPDNAIISGTPCKILIKKLQDDLSMKVVSFDDFGDFFKIIGSKFK